MGRWRVRPGLWSSVLWAKNGLAAEVAAVGLRVGTGVESQERAGDSGAGAASGHQPLCAGFAGGCYALAWGRVRACRAARVSPAGLPSGAWCGQVSGRSGRGTLAAGSDSRAAHGSVNSSPEQ